MTELNSIMLVFGVTGVILFIINRVTSDAQHYKRIESAYSCCFLVFLASLIIYCIMLDVQSGLVDKVLTIN